MSIEMNVSLFGDTYLVPTKTSDHELTSGKNRPITNLPCPKNPTGASRMFIFCDSARRAGARAGGRARARAGARPPTEAPLPVPVRRLACTFKSRSVPAHSNRGPSPYFQIESRGSRGHAGRASRARGGQAKPRRRPPARGGHAGLRALSNREPRVPGARPPSAPPHPPIGALPVGRTPPSVTGCARADIQIRVRGPVVWANLPSRFRR